MPCTPAELDAAERVAVFLDHWNDNPNTDPKRIATCSSVMGAQGADLTVADLTALVHAAGLRQRPHRAVRYVHLGPFQWQADVDGRTYRVEHRAAQAAQDGQPPYHGWTFTPELHLVGRTHTLEQMRTLLRHHRDEHGGDTCPTT